MDSPLSPTTESASSLAQSETGSPGATSYNQKAQTTGQQIGQVSLSSVVGINGPTQPPTSNSVSPNPSSALSQTGSTFSRATLKSSSTSSSDRDNRLPNGTVAGVIIGVALGLALITFLITFFAMRRQTSSRSPKKTRDLDPSPMRRPEKEKPLPKDLTDINKPGRFTALDHCLPQSADDETIRRKARATMDQIELHVEGYYQNRRNSGTKSTEAQLAAFDSQYLPGQLSVLLPQSKVARSIIKHVLSLLATSSISPTGVQARSLLPPEFSLMPSRIQSAKAVVSKNTGFEQAVSRWRELTSYLWTNVSDHTLYIAQRDRQIDGIVQDFTQAFSPWKNLQFTEEQRIQSLSTILKGVADLGIWLFSQPSEFQFLWPDRGGPKTDKVIATPALAKMTDERGCSLPEVQVIVPMDTGNRL